MTTPAPNAPLPHLARTPVPLIGARAAGLGVACMVLAALLHSIGSVLSKIVLLVFSVPELALMRTSLTLLTLLVVAICYYRKSLKLTLRDLPTFMGYGIAAMVMSPLMFFNAIERVSVGIVLIVEYTAPILIILWLRVMRGVSIRPAVLAGMVACSSGLALVALPAGGVTLDGIGILFAFGAAMSLAAGYLFSERALQQKPAVIVSLLGYAVGCLAWTIAVPAWQFPQHLLTEVVGIPNTAGFPPVAAFWLIIVIAVLGSVTPGLLVLQGVKLLGPARASAVSMIEPIFSAAIAWVLLAEYLSTLQILGGALALASLVYLEGPWRKPAAMPPN